ncbi:hypothetical protein C8F04DRAFT_1139050, partial [Mycena alexandri]
IFFFLTVSDMMNFNSHFHRDMKKYKLPWRSLKLSLFSSILTMSFTSTTTAQEVATVLADQIEGKNVLITGTSINGIGFETARVLAKYANLVIITGYNSERLTLSKEAIEKEVPGANIRSLVLDLSSRVAVRKAATEVNAYPEPIHVLINNAAAANQIATDHINLFLFTKLLTPKLFAALTSTYTARVPGGVNLTTLAHPDPEK